MKRFTFHYSVIAAATVVLMTLVSPVHANDQLLRKIESAQNRLSKVEGQVSRERQSLSKQLNKLEKEVRELRKKTAVARRLADEKTLSLGQLEDRLEGWNQQQVYQRNLLHRFLQQRGEQSNRPASDVTTSDQIEQVLKYSNSIESFLFPRWQERQLTITDGHIKSLPTLAMGPIIVYWDNEAETGGLATQKDGYLQADLAFAGKNSNAVASLYENGQGQLAFDPTLTRALAKQKHSESIIEHVTKGGLWAIPILFFALLALTVALFKVVQLWRLPSVTRFTPGAIKTVLNDTNSAVAGEVRGMQKTLLEIAQKAPSSRQRDDQMFMQLQDDRHYLDRWVGVISITASVSPLLGLLGTVSGMIETFKMMTLFGSGDPEVVSGGIAQALVTTELGLVVAIPALILSAVLSRRAKFYYNELESFAVLLSKTDDDTDEEVSHV